MLTIFSNILYKEVESEYGKFRALLTRKNNNDLSIEMILDLKRKINKIDNDSRTITYGLTAENRKEFIGNMDTNRMLCAYQSGITDIATLYFQNLFYLIDDIIHLKKPLIMATSGILSTVQNSLYLCGSTRFADSSMRMLFNNCLYGQIPCGGFYYFINMIHTNNTNNNNKLLLLYSILNGQPLSCWNLYDVGFVDWIMPTPNNVLLFNHIGNDIDKTFNFNFKQQDEFRHRSMIKSIIEFYDRGIFLLT